MSSQAPLERLIEQAAAGSHSAFGDLYRLLAPSVLGYLTAQGVAEPEDLCSEVFIGIFRSIASFRGTDPEFRSWVFTIAHRRITDERRRNGRRGASVGLSDAALVESPSGDAAHQAGQRMGTARVLEICATLVPDQRDVLLLRLVCDLTVEQTGDILGKSPGAVKALQRRGLSTLTRLSIRQ